MWLVIESSSTVHLLYQAPYEAKMKRKREALLRKITLVAIALF